VSDAAEARARALTRGAELAARWTRCVPGLKQSALRVEITGRGALPVAAALDVLAGRAEQADPVAREVLAAAVLALTDAPAPLTDDLRVAAHEHGWLALARLLRKKAARAPAEPVPEPGDRPLPRAGTARPLSLGERKSLARRPTRAALERLMGDPHPDVIRNVLGNPRLTEDDVVRLAARRPAFADVLVEIARHPTWSQRIRVRRALVHNPFTPPEIAVPLVRLLIRPELVDILASTEVPPIVRAAAKELLERRPPVRARPHDTRQ
jgi:hypothetical protein